LDPPTRRWGAPARRLTWGRAVAVVSLLLFAVVVTVVVLSLSSSPRAVAAGPLSRAQASRVVDEFASAYGRRDSTAIARLLAPSVVRVSGSASERGRTAVLAGYRREFGSQAVPVAYELHHLRVSPGWVARASADYTLRLSGGSRVRGHVVFGVQRADGRALIGLIATRGA